MVRSGWQQTWVRIMTTMLMLCVMALIFIFSTQNADRSDQTSGFISRAIISILYTEYTLKTPEKQQEIYESVQYAVRKCAHFIEYTILGFSIRMCMESWFGNRMRKRYILLLLAYFCGTLYAGTDEWHQRKIDGRCGQLTDVLLDSCGVLFGAFLGDRLIIATERRKKGTGKNNANEYRTCQSRDPAEYR